MLEKLIALEPDRETIKTGRTFEVPVKDMPNLFSKNYVNIRKLRSGFNQTKSVAKEKPSRADFYEQINQARFDKKNKLLKLEKI